MPRCAAWCGGTAARITRRCCGAWLKESGLETPSAEDLIRFDRARKNKTLSNADWASPTDPEARIARMKDGTTHLAYKPEHAVDLDTGVIVAAGSIRPTRATPRPSPPRWNRPKPCSIWSACTHAGDPGRDDRRQGLSCARGTKGIGGQRLEEPHLGKGTKGFRPLAR